MHYTFLYLVTFFFVICTNAFAQTDYAQRIEKTHAVEVALDALEGDSLSVSSYNVSSYQDAASYDLPPVYVLAKNIVQESSQFYEPVSSVEPNVDAVSAASAPPEGYYADSQYLPSQKNELSFLDERSKNPFRVTGIIHSRVGVDSHGVEFSEANADLNELNYRLLNGTGLNNRENTHDSAIFSRVRLNLDWAITDAVAMHLNVTVDPWSYVGKTETQTVAGAGGDSVDVQYLYWRNTSYTLGRILATNLNGEGLALPEIKVKNNVVPAQRLTSIYNNIFDIPEMKINYNFQPIRELWFDIEPNDDWFVRIFPLAYENQAMTTDDPLGLSNTRQWWEESPWLRSWKSGNYNSAVGSKDFTKGYWDRSLSFAVKDSDGQRLTGLRGATIKYAPSEDTSFSATVASPKTLWEDYDDYTAIPGSARLKHYFSENLYVGLTGTMHVGYNPDYEKDAENYVGSADIGMMLAEGLELNAQASASTSKYDLTNETYKTDFTGQSYYVSLEGTNNPINMLKSDYYNLKADDGNGTFFKMKGYFGLMEDPFEATLSNYHETRDDSYWSRHLNFYPSLYAKMVGMDVEHATDEWTGPFAIGDGLDYGRKAMGWRGDWVFNPGSNETRWMFDGRHVTTTDDAHVETVARVQLEHEATDKLTIKAFALAHDLPETVAERDPFIVSSATGRPVVNKAIIDGEDPSVNTGSLGLKYQLTDKVTVNGVWEVTNDFVLGNDNFPRGLFNGSYNSPYLSDGLTYREEIMALDKDMQGYFDQAPYAYHNIFKAGLHWEPSDQWDVYFDYTRNPYKFAQMVDDNTNHYGVETAYIPNPKWGFFGRYTYSQAYDLNDLQHNKKLNYESYHNIFLETRYNPDTDSYLSLQYGSGPAYITADSSYNPMLEYYTAPVLETQHTVFMTFEKKF